MNKNIFTTKVVNQIMEIRNFGQTNMFDTKVVQKLAFEMGFYDLVNLIEENKKAYCHFILTGETEK